MVSTMAVISMIIIRTVLRTEEEVEEEEGEEGEVVEEVEGIPPPLGTLQRTFF